MDVPNGNRRGYSSARENRRETNRDAHRGRKREYNTDRFNRIIRSLIWTSPSNFVLFISYLNCMSIYLTATSIVVYFIVDTSAKKFNSKVFTMKSFILDNITHFLYVLVCYYLVKINFYHIFIIFWIRVCLKQIAHANKIQQHMLKVYDCFQVSCRNNTFWIHTRLHGECSTAR